MGAKRRLVFFCIFLLLLGGCGGRSHSEKAAFLKLRSMWLEKGSVTLRSEVRADYGERVYDFTLRYEGGGESGVLSVEKPLELEGVEAELSEKGVTLRYDGVLLDTGAILGNLSPLEAFPLLVRTWQKGFVTDCWRETWKGENCLAVQFDLTEAGETEERLCLSRFRPSDGAPLDAEFLAAGRTVLYCRFME